MITHLAADSENPMAETQFEAVWAGGMQIVGKRDVVVVNAGDGTGGKYECLVKSQTDSDLWYHIKQTAQKGWTCSCPLYKGARSANTLLPRFYLSTKESKGSESDSSSDANLRMPPRGGVCIVEA